jgi:hypothetical protein
MGTPFEETGLVGDSADDHQPQEEEQDVVRGFEYVESIPGRYDSRSQNGDGTQSRRSPFIQGLGPEYDEDQGDGEDDYSEDHANSVIKRKRKSHSHRTEPFRLPAGVFGMSAIFSS